MKRVAFDTTLLVFIVLGVVYATTFAHRHIGGVVNMAPLVEGDGKRQHPGLYYPASA